MIDTSGYERSRRGIGDEYAAKGATNAYARFLSQQRSNRQIADYTQNFQRQAPKFTASYGQRGLAGSGVRSGVYGKAMQNYVGDYSQNLNRQYADQAQQLRQYDLTAAEQTASKKSALADLETQKQREIAQAAQYLAALKPQFS